MTKKEMVAKMIEASTMKNKEKAVKAAMEQSDCIVEKLFSCFQNGTLDANYCAMCLCR